MATQPTDDDITVTAPTPRNSFETAKDSLTVTITSTSVEILVDLSKHTTGGYDYDILNNETVNKYTCMICTMIQREPTIVSCCGQHFCRSCFDRNASVNGMKCPHCLATDVQYFTNKQQQREIQCLRVQCCNADRGCRWTGDLGEMERHMEVECEQVVVNCPHRCGKRMERFRIGEHLHVATLCVKNKI